MYSTLLIVKAADSYIEYNYGIMMLTLCISRANVWWKITSVTRIIKEQFKTESIVLYANDAQM